MNTSRSIAEQHAEIVLDYVQEQSRAREAVREEAVVEAAAGDAVRGDSAAWRLGLVERLAEMAVAVAQTVTDDILAEAEARRAGLDAPAEASRRDPVVRLERISRCARMNLMLHARLEAHIEERAMAVAMASPVAAAAPKPSTGPNGPNAELWRRLFCPIQEKKAERLVREVIAAEVSDPDEVKRLRHELRDRLEGRDDDPRYVFDYQDQPFGAIVAILCQELGLSPDWSQWEKHDWAIEEAKTNAPGSPYAWPGYAARRAAGGPDAEPPRGVRGRLGVSDWGLMA